jgi:hypothetical protein
MTVAEKLTALRKKEQDIRKYPASSKWYTGLNNAISYFALAEETFNALEKFRHSWSAIYNLYMMLHVRGEFENDALSNWSKEMQGAPAVRDVARETPRSMLDAIQRAENQLLWNTESKRFREGKKILEAWRGKPIVSSADACKWLLLIGRDLRNAVSHPSINPAAPNVKKALNAAAPIFFKLAEAAIRVTIERPPAGATGRTTAYRSFLYPYLKNSESNFSDYYLEHLFEEGELFVFAEDEIKPALRELAQQYEKLRAVLRTADAETTQRDWLDAHLFPFLSEGSTGHLQRGGRIVAGEHVYEPDYVMARESGGAARTTPREYEGKEAGRALCCLVFTLPGRASLDTVTRVPISSNVNGEAEEPLTAMELAQRALLVSDVPWAVLTNGMQFRLLTKATAHKLHSFLEIDLHSVLDQHKQPAAQRAFGFFRGLFEVAAFVTRDDQERTRLDRVVRESERHGKEISDELKTNVFAALEELGEGFLDYLRRRPAELEDWRQLKAPESSANKFLVSDMLLEDIYQESLALMYRLLFLFYAESRDLLPMEHDLYRETYSLEAIRDDIIARRDDPDLTQNFFPKGETSLWERLQKLFHDVDKGSRLKALPIPAYNGGLFDPEKHEFLEQFKIGDYYLARAIDLLSRTRPGSQAGGEGRKKVTYRDLDIRHLGSIYEGILEYHARIADADLAVVEGAKKGQEYKPVPELTAAERQHLAQYQEAREENPDNTRLPRGCKVKGFKADGQYYLVYGGRESKRKSSGSYYTPDYIVQYIVENTLGPLVRGECRQQPVTLMRQEQATLGFFAEQPQLPAGQQLLSSDEILNLKVLDPAMGSGHFLVAATEYLAKAYHTAVLRESSGREGVKGEADLTRYKRLVAERCIYGVDLNPMAVELAKLSMWLYTMDRGRPLSFLDHHLKCGNAVIGAWIEDLGAPPEFDRNGKIKRRERDRRQGNLFEIHFREKVPLMVRELTNLMDRETNVREDIEYKKGLDRAVEQMKRPFRNLANVAIGAYFGDLADDYITLLMNVEKADNRQSEIAEERGSFHWELEFPEIFFDKHGREADKRGFDAVIGNPPYVRIQTITETADLDADFYKLNYISASKGNYDIYVVFIDQNVRLLNLEGRAGLITSHKFFNAKYGEPLREILSKGQHLSHIVHFGDQQLFEGASTYTCLLFLNKGGGDECYFVKAHNANEWANNGNGAERQLPAIQFTKAEWNISVGGGTDLLDKLSTMPIKLADVTSRIFQGIKTSADKIYIVEEVERQKNRVKAFSRQKGAEYWLEPDLLHPLIKGGDSRRYSLSRTNRLILFPYAEQEGGVVGLITVADFKKYYPLTWAYLNDHRSDLESREDGKMRGEKWYAFGRSQALDVMPLPKIFTPDIAARAAFSVDDSGEAFFTGGVSGGYGVLVLPEYSREYVLGLLNSKLLEWIIRQSSMPMRGGYYSYESRFIRNLPIRTANRSNPVEKKLHDQVVQLVKQMLSLNIRLAAAKPAKQQAIQEQIEQTDRHIDTLVYELYELTDEEIAIVEETFK